MLIQRIPGVFNYCDRWCERCRLQRACDVFQDIKAYESGVPVDRDVPAPEWLASIPDIEVTPDELAQQRADQERRDRLTRSHPICERASRYAARVHEWTLLQDPARPPGDPVIGLALESIQMLALTISAKAHRAVHELVDREAGDEWVDRTLDPRGVQSDGNGSAKVVRLAIRESVSAWRVVAMDPDEHVVDARAMMTLLRELDVALDAAFPDAMEFVRPGFDE